MKRVKEFLRNHWDQKSPLLLGLSGGPDSKALLFSLLDAGCDRLHVAHIDHGWREESAIEAEMLKKEIKALKLNYHSTRLNDFPKVNQEDAARNERLKYFQSLFEKIPFQALFLGHHADDLAETILKRIFEGAHLPNLRGMQQKSVLKGIPVWRPLLGVQKKEILAFLQERGIQSINDRTNQDPKYLRSRLKREIFPFLEQNFGKKILGNLCLLSERADELHKYLESQIVDVEVKRGDIIEIPLTTLKRIERRHLLQKVGAEEGITISRGVLERLLDFVDGNQLKKVMLSPYLFISGQGKVLFIKTLVQ